MSNVEELLTTILAEMTAVRGECKRTAAGLERLVELAEVKREARERQSDAPGRQRGEKKDLLTVTGAVASFGLATDRSGNPKLTKKKNEYWSLKLSTGFAANIFSSTQAATCSKAYDEDLTLIVEYEQNGQYHNVEGVRLGAAASESNNAGRTPPVDAPEEDAPF